MDSSTEGVYSQQQIKIDNSCLTLPLNYNHKNLTPVPHVLYSKGRLRLNFNREDSIRQLSRLTHKPEDEIIERLLNGERKKIKSSDSLESLFRLKRKLEARGLDVYIETDAE